MVIQVVNKLGAKFFIEVMNVPPSMQERYKTKFVYGYREYAVENTAEQVEWYKTRIEEGMTLVN
jgi:hypothetical protein